MSQHETGNARLAVVSHYSKPWTNQLHVDARTLNDSSEACCIKQFRPQRTRLSVAAASAAAARCLTLGNDSFTVSRRYLHPSPICIMAHTRRSARHVGM